MDKGEVFAKLVHIATEHDTIVRFAPVKQKG